MGWSMPRARRSYYSGPCSVDDDAAAQHCRIWNKKDGDFTGQEKMNIEYRVHLGGQCRSDVGARGLLSRGRVRGLLRGRDGRHLHGDQDRVREPVTPDTATVAREKIAICGACSASISRASTGADARTITEGSVDLTFDIQ
jgi:hypothetical protein